MLLRSDSQLLVHQLTGRYRVKTEHLQPLLPTCAGSSPPDSIDVTFEHVPREANVEADRLANAGVDAWLADGIAAERYRCRGGAGRAAAVRTVEVRVEESPDSTGQDAGESQAGATSRRGNREETAGPSGPVRVQRWGKSPPARRATAAAR